MHKTLKKILKVHIKSLSEASLKFEISTIQNHHDISLTFEFCWHQQFEAYTYTKTGPKAHALTQKTSTHTNSNAQNQASIHFYFPYFINLLLWNYGEAIEGREK